MLKNRPIVKGLGSLLKHTFDPEKAIAEVRAQLNASSQAIEFINSDGWKVLADGYRRMIAQEQAYMSALCKEAKKNQDEIQRRSDFISACDLLLTMTDRIIEEHTRNIKTVNEGTAA